VKVKIEKQAAGYQIEADAGQLHQVILNLLTNAAEAIEDGPGCIS
jgi:signal transduction histidine kinase